MSDPTKVEDGKPVDLKEEEPTGVAAPVDNAVDGKAASGDTRETANVKEEDDAKEPVDTKDEDLKKSSIAHPPKNMLRVRRTDDEGNARKNLFDPTVRGESSNHDEIRTQVHFYFSDSNLPTDNYMLELTGGAENKAVPLTKITSFKRMHRYKPYEAVVAALKESRFLVLAGEEGKETIQRKNPFNPKNSERKKIDEQSVYVKGFGNEEPSTQFDIEAFFSQYGAFNSVRLRRGDDGGFKGSVFVEWADKETADKFMALDPKPQWKTDHDLLILWKLDYVKEKNDGIKDGTIQPGKSGFRGRGGDRGRGRGGRGRHGGRHGNHHNGGDRDNWKQRRDHDQKRGFRGGRGGQRDRDEKPAADARDVGPPKINVAGGDADKANGKRSREEDGSKDEPATKKVDAKTTETEAS